MISLNVSYLICQSKDTEWINGLKKNNKDPYYAICKRLTSDVRTHRLKVKT